MINHFLLRYSVFNIHTLWNKQNITWKNIPWNQFSLQGNLLINTVMSLNFCISTGNCRNSLSHFIRKNCTKEITKYLIWRSFFCETEFLIFPDCTVLWECTLNSKSCHMGILIWQIFEFRVHSWHTWEIFSWK